MRRALLVVALTGACAAAAWGQTVYRCGPDGRTFSDQPCAGGLEVQADPDRRKPEQQQEAARVAEREAALASQLAQERHAREAAPVPGAGRVGPEAAKPASAPLGHKKKQKRHAKRRQQAVDDDGRTRYAVPPPQRSRP